MKNIPKGDAFVIVLVSVVTVFTDLAIAVGLGIIVSALVFAWKKGENIDIDPIVNEVIIDFKHARVFDHSGIEAINMLTDKYRKLGKVLHLRHLSEECYQLIKNADKIVEVNIIEDPHYKVADDSLA